MEDKVLRTGGAIALVLVLMMAGIAGMFLVLPSAEGAPGDSKLEPILDESLIKNLSIDRDYAFNTSEQKVNISWDNYPWSDNVAPIELYVKMRNTVLGWSETLLFWDEASSLTPLPRFFIWEFDRTLTPRTDYVINVTIVVFNSTVSDFYGDIDEGIFSIFDGTNMVQDIQSVPSSAVNDGSHWVNTTFLVNRTMLDLEAPDLPFTSMIKYNLFNEETGEWVLPGGFGPDSTAPTGIVKGKEVQGATQHFWFNWTVPLGQDIGQYYFALHVRDGWNHSESHNGTAFEVLLRELPPVMINGTIHLVEDSYVHIDLSDHFTDENGQALTFWTNTSEPENISLVWTSDERLNITALPDWNGEEALTMWVDDSASNNVSFQMVVHVEPVNDLPVPTSQTLSLLRNEMDFSKDIRTLFSDVDGTSVNLSFEVNKTLTDGNLSVVYNSTSFELSVVPVLNWTGTTTFTIKVTEENESAIFTMTVSVVPRTFTVTGKVTYEANGTHLDKISVDKLVATLSFGTNVVTTDNVTFSYQIVLEEGTYNLSVATNLPTEKLYNETAKRSGYEPYANEVFILNSNRTKNIEFKWKDYIPQNLASWSDLDFNNTDIEEEEDGAWLVILPVKNVTKTGYDRLNISLIIMNKDDKVEDTVQFQMEWNATAKHFWVLLDKDRMENVSEGKRQYYFRDDMGNESSAQKFEFKEKDEGAGWITVIVLIILIVLVLIALVFIMRKPSEEEEEETEEGEKEEEEAEARKCPGCSETITDPEASECPYCGEELGEE